MPSISFELKTITPLFLAGADQTEAELRPSAFRGALRYWFRVIAACVTDLNTVKEWENKIFGDTTGAGKVIIRIQASQVVSKDCLKKELNFPGINYLFFSTYKNNNRDARGCFPPNQQFKLILQTRLPRQEDIQYLNLAVGAAWMLINLGAIGSRSNRGAGSLKIINEPENKPFPIDFKLIANSLSDFSNQLQQGIKLIKQQYKEILSSGSINLALNPDFDILDCNTANIYLWQSPQEKDNKKWDYILNSFGEIYKKFRLRYNQAIADDYKEIKDWLKNSGKTQVTTVKRAAFGLPLQFRFNSLNGKSAFLEGTEEFKRSSSPLHIKVIEICPQKMAILVIHFKTKLLPPNAKLLLKSQNVGKPLKLSVPNQDIIEKEFIPYIKTITQVVIP